MRRLALFVAVVLAIVVMATGRPVNAHHKPTHSRGTTTTTSSTTTTTISPPDPTGIDPDGGNAPGQPYTQPGRHLSNDHSFFPVAVYLEAGHRCGTIASRGINTYVGIHANSDLNAFAANCPDTSLLVQVNELGTQGLTLNHPVYDGYLLYDEPDLIYGPGNDPWSGQEGWNTCIPIQDQGGQCGFTVLDAMQARISPNDMTYVNYGLFMMPTPGGFSTSDQDCSTFVNGWGDVVSMDYYGFTHPGSTEFHKRGAFYGEQVDRLQFCDGLSGGTAPLDRKPIWGVVELGHPYSESFAPTITPAQMRSATWHTIIAGARGVLYFNHSFGGTCQTDSVLTSTCSSSVTMQSAVTELTGQIRQFAPVLNADFAAGVTLSSNLEAMAKLGADGTYVFAGANWGPSGGDQFGTITVPGASGTAEVLYENRTVPVVDGVITDHFGGPNAVHIYRLP